MDLRSPALTVTISGTNASFIQGNEIASGFRGTVYHAQLDNDARLRFEQELIEIEQQLTLRETELTQNQDLALLTEDELKNFYDNFYKDSLRKSLLQKKRDIKSLLEKKWVIKEVLTSAFEKTEPQISTRYIDTSEPVKTDTGFFTWLWEFFGFAPESGKTRWVMEYVPETRLDLTGHDDKTILQLIFELTVRTNLFHHNTTKGDAIVHGDIRGPNINFAINTEEGKISADYLDYGHSFTLSDNANKQSLNTKTFSLVWCEEGGGLCGQFPPEAYKYSMFGIKTDIYMLANLVGKRLLEIFPETSDVHPFVKTYLHRAAAADYDTRPDSDEFLKFITTLNNFYNSDEERMPFYKARLAVLSADKWNKNTGIKKDNGEDIKWGDLFSHDSNPFFTDKENIAICHIAATDCEIEWSVDFIKTVSRLDQNLLMDKKIMKCLADYPEFCNAFANQNMNPDSLPSILPLINGYGPIAKQRELGFAFISHFLERANSPEEVQGITANLVALLGNREIGGSSQIDYLFARQGWITTLSIHMHSWIHPDTNVSLDVSATWLKLMDMTAKRENYLARKKVKVEDFKQEFLEDYNNAGCCHQLFSGMKDKLDKLDKKKKKLTIDKVIQYAERKPGSRTAKVLDELATRTQIKNI